MSDFVPSELQHNWISRLQCCSAVGYCDQSLNECTLISNFQLCFSPSIWNLYVATCCYENKTNLGAAVHIQVPFKYVCQHFFQLLADRKVWRIRSAPGIKLSAPAIVVELLQVQTCQRKIDWVIDITETLELTNFSEIFDYVFISLASAFVGICCQLPHWNSPEKGNHNWGSYSLTFAHISNLTWFVNFN